MPERLVRQRAAGDPHGVLAIVQARIGSQRFPGKSLMPLCGSTVLGVLLQRLKRSAAIDRLVVATGAGPRDNPIESLAQSHGVRCVRGSESDVLSRFVRALEEYPAELVVRVCADSPLTDPEQVDHLVTWFGASAFDYAYNNYSECGLPGGLGAEIMQSRVLRLLDQRAVRPEHREHVTSLVRDNPQDFRIGIPPTEWSAYPTVDLDVDYPEDLHFLESLCEFLAPDRRPYWTTPEIIQVLQERPGLIGLRHARANA